MESGIEPKTSTLQVCDMLSHLPDVGDVSIFPQKAIKACVSGWIPFNSNREV
jgi:hypothetical protein